MINKIYVFIFLGEFGYELFNWQGKVKKFYKTLGEGEIIVCAGRRGLDIIYPYAKYYQDLQYKFDDDQDPFDIFKQSKIKSTEETLDLIKKRQLEENKNKKLN